MNTLLLISALTFTPLFAGLTLLLLPRSRHSVGRAVGLSSSAIVALLFVVLCCRLDTSTGATQHYKLSWVPSLDIYYHVGLDGLNILFVGLTALLVPLAILATSRGLERSTSYYGLILCLQSGLLGAFTALDFFHWFLFFELSLVPAFFLVRLWGGPGRVAASNQFFLYTMSGSIALLLAFLGLYLATNTFDFLELAKIGQQGSLVTAVGQKFGLTSPSASTAATLIFLGIFFGFAIKTPLWPFHTWLPLTYAEAPTSTVMLLTGAMSKLGVYGFLRVLLPIFPQQIRELAPWLLGLTVVSIVYSAGAALAQTDLKRLLGYSSINHLGYCLLGVFAISAAPPAGGVLAPASALNGVLLQAFNHGLTAATLFWFVAILEARSGGARELLNFGGLRQPAPILCGLMGVALFSSLGLPGLNGFIGEFLIFNGVFHLVPWAAVISTLGLLLTAWLILQVLHSIFLGPGTWSSFPDLTTVERVHLTLPIGLMLFLGIWPQAALYWVNAKVTDMVRNLGF